MKSLEALEYYWKICNLNQTDYEIIKQDLERLDKLEKQNQELKEYSYLLELSKQHEEFKNEKFKKAINLIKNKLGLRPCKYGKVYTISVLDDKTLTEKQYEFIKEVLKDE